MHDIGGRVGFELAATSPQRVDFAGAQHNRRRRHLPPALVDGGPLPAAGQGRQPNDFADLDTLKAHLLAFGRRYEQIAAPSQWKLNREDLHPLLAKAGSAPILAADSPPRACTASSVAGKPG
jgi:hypothetical protein